MITKLQSFQTPTSNKTKLQNYKITKATPRFPPKRKPTNHAFTDPRSRHAPDISATLVHERNELKDETRQRSKKQK